MNCIGWPKRGRRARDAGLALCVSHLHDVVHPPRFFRRSSEAQRPSLSPRTTDRTRRHMIARDVASVKGETRAISKISCLISRPVRLVRGPCGLRGPMSFSREQLRPGSTVWPPEFLLYKELRAGRRPIWCTHSIHHGSQGNSDRWSSPIGPRWTCSRYSGPTSWVTPESASGAGGGSDGPGGTERARLEVAGQGSPRSTGLGRHMRRTAADQRMM